eukprot:1146349-Pelagomonas_calceolata.AAC.2
MQHARAGAHLRDARNVSNPHARLQLDSSCSHILEKPRMQTSAKQKLQAQDAARRAARWQRRGAAQSIRSSCHFTTMCSLSCRGAGAGAGVHASGLCSSPGPSYFACVPPLCSAASVQGSKAAGPDCRKQATSSSKGARVPATRGSRHRHSSPRSASRSLIRLQQSLLIKKPPRGIRNMHCCFSAAAVAATMSGTRSAGMQQPCLALPCVLAWRRCRSVERPSKATALEQYNDGAALTIESACIQWFKLLHHCAEFMLGIMVEQQGEQIVKAKRVKATELHNLLQRKRIQQLGKVVVAGSKAETKGQAVPFAAREMKKGRKKEDYASQIWAACMQERLAGRSAAKGTAWPTRQQLFSACCSACAQA